MELSQMTIGLIGIGIFLFLLAIGQNVGIVMLIAGFIGIWIMKGLDGALLTTAFTVYRTIASQFLVVLPLFILMGMAAAHTGVSDDTFKCLNKWVGHFPGGLAMAATAACTIFGAVCGNVVATAATLGKVALPEMRKYKYQDSLSAGTIATGGNLGALVPPSTALIVYGFITETPIGELFAGGILPAVILTLLFIIQIYFQVKMDPSLCEMAPKSTWKERLISLKGLIGVAIIFVIAMGGIMAGYFTPVEAGAIGSVAMYIIGFVNRRMTWRGAINALLDAGKISAMIMLLLQGTTLFSTFLTMSEITQDFSNWMLGCGLNRYILLIVINIFFFLLGTFMDSWALLIIALPVFFPIVVDLGFDPVHFGVLCALSVMIGNVSPPVGVTVFALRGVAPDISVATIYKGCMPFMATMCAYTLVLIYVPWISVVLPNMIYPLRMAAGMH